MSATGTISFPFLQMAFSLSFSPEFFDGIDTPELIECSGCPLSVLQAIESLSREQRAAIARDVFGVDAADLSDDLIQQQVLKTDTCTNLTSPVEVWIDREGFHTVLVHDDPQAG